MPEDGIDTHQVPAGGLAVGGEMVLRGEDEKNLGSHFHGLYNFF